MDKWIEDKISRLLNEYGDVPPPWIILPDKHPYSICWRMGLGESHIEVWGNWWESQLYNEDQRIAYFRKWSPPPMWLEWTIEVIWNLRPWEQKEDFDYLPYFSRMEDLGFGSKENYEKDFNDPKWLER